MKLHHVGIVVKDIKRSVAWYTTKFKYSNIISIHYGGIMSQMNKLDQRQQLMVVTMEECGELVQACSKILRRQELYADTKYVQNLKDEIGDVYTMLKLMVEHDVVSWDELEKRNDHKREKLKKWSDLIE